MYGKIEVEIKGLTPLLMNRLDPEKLKSKPGPKGQEYDVEEEARSAAYIAKIDGEEQLYIPSQAVYSMIIQTAKQYRSKRMSLSSLLAGTIRIEPEKIPLGHCEYEVDVRPVIVQRARVLRARAKVNDWSARFTIVYNEKILPETVIKTLKTIVEDAGTRVGLLDYRPQKKGWFGTFTVEKWG